MEQLRLSWEYLLQESAAHRQFYLQLFGIAMTAALAAVASRHLGGLGDAPASALLAATAALAAYSLFRLRLLPRSLRRSLRILQRTIDRLKDEEEG